MLRKWLSKRRDADPSLPGPFQMTILCAAFFANEITVTYELIYMVTLERLLSLPTHFVSLPGVVASAATFLIVPFMGRYSDRGDRYKRRSAMVVLSGALQFVGPLLLMFACIEYMSLEMEMEERRTVYEALANQTTETPPLSAGAGNNMTSFPPLGLNSQDAFDNNASAVQQYDTPIALPRVDLSHSNVHGSVSSTLTATLALVSFSIMAIGFDIGTTSIRSFVLDSVPVEVHSKVLSIGVMVSSLGGCVFAFLGLLDVNSLVGREEDPTLLRSVLLSGFLMLSVLVTVPVTLLYGRHLKAKFGGRASEHSPEVKVKGGDVLMLEMNGGGEKLKNGVTHSITDDLVKASQSERSIDKIIAGGMNGVHKEVHDIKEFEKSARWNGSEVQAFLDEKSSPEDAKIGPYETFEHTGNGTSFLSCNGHSEVTPAAKENEVAQNGHCVSTPALEICSQDASSQGFSASARSWVASVKRKIGTFYFRLLFLICLVTFFSSGTSIAFEVYFSTFLSMGVFGGDPEAPLKSDLKRRFDQGTVVASEGTLIFMATFFLYNFAHWKVASRVGLVTEYLVVSLIAMPLLLAMALTKILTIFYVVALLNGVYRTILFTTPFVMATELIDGHAEELELADPEDKNTNETTSPSLSEPPSSSTTTTTYLPSPGADDNTQQPPPTGHCDSGSESGSEAEHGTYGATIAMVGAMIPLSDLVLSSLMGPLLALTDDPAMPMIFGFAFGMAATVALVGVAVYRRRAGR